MHELMGTILHEIFAEMIMPMSLLNIIFLIQQEKKNYFERYMLNITAFLFSAVNRVWKRYLRYLKKSRPWIFKQVEKHQLLYNNQLSLNCKALSSAISYQILAECDNEYVKLCLLVFLLPRIIFKQWDNPNIESIKNT